MAESRKNGAAVQTTFTKQKRELAKANELIASIRAQEKRSQRFSPDGKLQTEERETYLVDEPENIAAKVLTIVESVVRQHGSRQRANGVNTGAFEFRDIRVELTVPQLRALQEAAKTIRALVEKLPVENKRYMPNCEIDGRPAYATTMEQVKERKTRWVPYVDKDSPKPLTYAEEYDEVLYQTRQVTIDHGLATSKIVALKEMVGDLESAIQIAIDEANAKPHDQDETLNKTIGLITAAFNNAIDG